MSTDTGGAPPSGGFGRASGAALRTAAPCIHHRQPRRRDVRGNFEQQLLGGNE